jgi:hypothetical protein
LTSNEEEFERLVAMKPDDEQKKQADLDNESLDALKFLMLPPKETKPPELKTIAWNIVAFLVLFFALIATAGWIGMTSWNNLTDVTGLPEVTWLEGVSAFLLLWVSSIATRSGYRRR